MAAHPRICSWPKMWEHRTDFYVNLCAGFWGYTGSAHLHPFVDLAEWAPFVELCGRISLLQNTNRGLIPGEMLFMFNKKFT